jgi:hypothetical protein
MAIDIDLKVPKDERQTVKTARLAAWVSRVPMRDFRCPLG